MSTQQRHLYVVFSSTPWKMGSFIRMMTHNGYNHVAIATDPDLKRLYSFARKHCNTPFYGGFVCESAVRYRNKGHIADVKICAVPVTEEQYRIACEKLDEMRKNSDEYFYNLFSALVQPLNVRVRIPNAFTCVEFAVYLLALCGACPSLEPMFTYTIRELEMYLASYVIYRGEFPKPKVKNTQDKFCERQGIVKATRLTVISNARLVGAMVRKKENR